MVKCGVLFEVRTELLNITKGLNSLMDNECVKISKYEMFEVGT
jgi:hypothetical protein